MQISSDKITFLVGNENVINGIYKSPALPMFSDAAVDFLADLSRLLLKDKRVRSFVDITSYAYWIRRASLEAEKAKYPDRKYRLGRGMAFHIAPSNVPVNFAVSMTSSLLAGNATVIRVSDKDFEQVDIISDAVNELLCEKYKNMIPYICIVRYSHDDEITAALSSVCDIRIIWGGNNTINAIRRAPIPARAIEMAFADRHSIAVIDAKAYLESDAKDVAKGFYTDTYYMDQNACSSPRLVVWRGNADAVSEARLQFWSNLKELVDNDYNMSPIQAVDKYSSFCDIAMDKTGIKMISDDNSLIRVEVNELSEDLMNYKTSGGYFFEYITEDLNSIVPVLTKECQTIAVLGVSKSEISDLVFNYGVRGVDRIVPLGQTMALEFIWDGYKMIENMTRYVYAGE